MIDVSADIEYFSERRRPGFPHLTPLGQDFPGDITMKSDSHIQDPQSRPLCPKVNESSVEIRKTPSRFRRKKQFDGPTASIYNKNFKSMPKNF